MDKIKLYCYTDETGQDTAGRFFLVSVVLIDSAKKDELEAKLEEIEKRTGKNKKKWAKEELGIRIQYIKEIAKIKILQYSLYYSVYFETKEYMHLTTLSIAKAILSKNMDDYAATIVIDGLTKKDTEKVKKDLKSLKIRYDAIRGMKDEQSAFLRLADGMAGFMRDYIEKKPYADELFKLLRGKKIAIEA
jgi:hypothetical protein